MNRAVSSFILELQDGQIVPEAVPVNSGLSVGFFAQQFGSPIPAAILYQGAAPGQIAGFYQLNVRVPANTMTGHTWVQFGIGLGGQHYTINEGIWLK